MLNRLTKSAEVQTQVDEEYFKINMEGHQMRLKLENTLKNCHQVGGRPPSRAPPTPDSGLPLRRLALTRVLACLRRSCRSWRNSEWKFCATS